MEFTMEQYRESAGFLRERLGDFAPKIAMVLGSGLGYLGDQVERPIFVDYRDIPHFKASTAPGHKGRLVFGFLEGKPVAVMQGRMHHYEGYSYEEVTYAVRVLRLLGCDTLVVTNAAGCVNTSWQAGDLMLITDHIKLFSVSPLRGENLPEFGTRFPDASRLYTPRLQALARQVAAGTGCRLALTFSQGYPAVWNPPDLLARVEAVCPVSRLDRPALITEDFSWYQKTLPGMFFFLGTGNTEALHSDRFDYPEEILVKGADFFQELAEKF